MSTEQRIIPVGKDLPPMASGERPSLQRANPAGARTKKSGDRWTTLNYFADVTARTLQPGAVAVWFQLFRNAKRDGLVRISQVELARRVGRSERTVYTTLRTLESVGLLTLVCRGSVHAGPSVYRIRGRRTDDSTTGSGLPVNSGSSMQKQRKCTSDCP